VTLASSCGSVENLSPSVECGCRQNRRPSRVMESLLTLTFLSRRSQSASRRDDQCVIPIARNASGGGVMGTDRISAIAVSVSTVLRPPVRAASSSPARPSSAYCRRHLTTVGSVHPPLGDLRSSQALGGQQHDPCPLRHPRRRSPVPQPSLQLARSASLTVRMRTRFGMSHRHASLMKTNTQTRIRTIGAAAVRTSA
jgi:hypothetical protein